MRRMRSEVFRLVASVTRPASERQLLPTALRYQLSRVYPSALPRGGGEAPTMVAWDVLYPSTVLCVETIRIPRIQRTAGRRAELM